MADATLTQPLSGVGSTAETNRLLGGDYFSSTGSQLKSFTPTVVTNANISEKTAPDNATKLASLSQHPALKDASGNVIGNWNNDANGYLDSSGSKIQPNGTFNGKQTSDSSTSNSSVNADSSVDSIMAFMNGGEAPTDTSILEKDPILKAEYNLVSGLKASNDAEYNSTVQTIKSLYADKISKLETAQKASTASVNQSLALSGSSQYAPISTQGILDAKTRTDMDAITTLQNEEQSLIAKALSAKNANDEKTVADTLALYDKKHTELLEQAQKVKDTLQKEKDAINQIALDAKKGGATDAAVSAITSSHDYATAVKNAGDYLQTATGTLGDYLQYKRDALAKGLVPSDYQAYKDEQDAKDAKRKVTEAYNTAYGSAQGKAAGEAASGVGANDVAPADVVEGGITQATGLDLVTFNYLTQGTSALTRMTAPQRQKVMADANNWLNKTGTDYATFQSQYKAQNTVLQANIERAANTKVYAGEASGSADALMAVIDAKDLGKIKASNIVKLMAGEQVNDATTMKYRVQLGFMANDLAGYLAAARGAKSPELKDMNDAANMISEGLNKGSVQAFKDSINANEEKVNAVVDNSVTSAQRSVWGLFGVGDKYKAKSVAVDPRVGVDSYVKLHPDKSETIAKLYEIPGATDQDVYDYINQLPK